MATAARPVRRPYTSAMNAAPCSWRVVTCRIDSERESDSRRSRVSSPGTEKTYSQRSGLEARNEKVCRGPRAGTG